MEINENIQVIGTQWEEGHLLILTAKIISNCFSWTKKSFHKISKHFKD